MFRYLGEKIPSCSILCLCVASGFQVWWIEWCDRHLCHVTASDHA